MANGATQQTTDGFAVISQSITHYMEGDGSTLIFPTGEIASAVGAVSNWVAGTTNDWATKTKTTHYTHNTDYTANPITITYESGNAPLAKVAAVDKVTLDTKANHGPSDFIKFYATDGTAYGCWIKKVNAATAQVDVLTCDTLANSVDRDFFVSYAVDGTKYAVYLDKTGSSVAPTSVRYTECDQKVKADISGATTAADVATIVAAAFNGLTGFTTDETITDVTDGTLIFTQDATGYCTTPKDYAYNSTTAGSAGGAFAWTQTTQGDAAVEPTAAAWTSLVTARKAVAAVAADSTAAQVAATVRAAVAAITGIASKITVGSVSTATFSLTQVTGGDCTVPAVSNRDGSGVGAITVENYTLGKTDTMKVVLTQTGSPFYTETNSSF